MAKFSDPVLNLENLKPGTVWTMVPGFSRYRISRTGYVAYQLYGKWRIKTPPVAQSGHRVLGLSENKTTRTVNLHRLLAETFLESPSTAHKWVKFKDGDITNLVVENLEWIDVPPTRGKKKKQRHSSAERTKIAALLADPARTFKDQVKSVAEDMDLPVTYVRHLVPGKVYQDRDTSSPEHVKRDLHKPPADASVEEWRAIPEASGYDISSWGRVRTWKGLEPSFLRQRTNEGGYKAVMFWLGKTGESLQRVTHRFVASAFCPEPKENETVVNHLDGDKQNNHYSNLEWTTHSENMKHAHATGLWKQSASHGKRWKRPPVEAYEAIRASSCPDESQWKQVVVEAIRRHSSWADQTLSDLQGEIWKPINDRWGLRTKVEVSSLGRVRRQESKKLLLQGLSTHGYPLSRLYGKKGRCVLVKTHTLVAEAFFCPRPSTRHVVNHKDLDKHNNRVDNLEWVTYKENSKHWSDIKSRASARAHTLE